MNSFPDLANAIESIDHELARGTKFLRFSLEAEREYETTIRADRTRYLIIASLIGLGFYDIFLINDWQMVGDVFREALILRLGICTPIAVIAIALVMLKPSRAVREGIAGAVGVVGVVPILWLFMISHAPNRMTYNSGLLIIMLFVTNVQRVQFRYAVPSVIGMLVLQFLAITHTSLYDAALVRSDMMFFISSAILMLFAAYMLEREARRTYLLAARGRLLNQQLDRAAKIDPLTGLWNRRHLNAVLDASWVAAAQTPQIVTVILLDIDHFKKFNDTAGHMEGDRCLERIGRRIQSALDDMEHIAVRFGGEEFLVFLPGADASEGQRAARILRQAIRYEAIPFPALGERAIVTASFGIATSFTSDLPAAALTAAADAALYEAKAAGRDCIFPRVGADVAGDDMRYARASA